jgi:energy-converting hydrogenase Eha subunit B
MPINEIDIVQTPSGQLVTEIELQQGLPGPPNTLAIGNVTTAETGVPAAANITGSSPSQLLHLTLPKGNTGTAATISAGTTTTGAAESSASVTNVGTNSAAVFNFTIPRGNTGATGTAATISAGTTTTGEAGSSASVTNVGTSSAAVFDFTIPRGNTGATGPATQLSVVSTSTGSAGSDASVTISGDAPNQSLAFTIPRGNTGATGPATQLSVASTTTGAAGSNASVAISGTAPNQSLAFTIPQGIQGIQGPTGSSGATALLTGYVSGAGTVAATDTVIEAVGKLNGNDELKAPIASLYPYIGGKLLTYLDEEAAIDDPLISAGDIYRKTAGGVDYVNPDNVPSLDLRFAADKTLTARRGPTPTFTRGSGATYIGSDGLIHGVDTSTTSNTIGTGSRTFTLAATAGQDQFWRAGDAVEASNGSNIMAGTVTSYDAVTQSLVCNMTTVSGTGTFTSWRIGYRGPRFDHDPVTLACKGLLIEEGRTNLFSSTNINSWGLIRCTRTAITGIGLTNQAATLTISETGSSRIQNVFVTLTTGVAYAISIRVKAGTLPSFVIADFVDSKFSRAFNLSTNQWAASGGSADFTNHTVTPNIDGWFLVSVIYTPTGATGAKNIVFDLQGVVGDTVSFDTPQIEAGSFPTSYIPTTTAPLIRSADVCSITGGDFTGFYNQSEGSFACNYSITARFTGNRYAASIEDTVGGTQNGFVFRNTNSASSFIAGSGYVSTIGAVTTTASKHILAYSGLSEFVYVKDSVVGTTTGSGTRDPSLPIRMSIGSLEGASGFTLCGHIAAIRYFKKRLPNAKLQALTV